MISALLTIILLYLTVVILWNFVKIAWVASWGIFKLLGIVLSVIAFPIIFIGALVLGIGLYLVVPIFLIIAAFRCIARA